MRESPSDPGSPVRAYRIGRHSVDRPIYDTTGAEDAPGRWNKKGEGVIYASEYYSTAVLETLVHLPVPQLPDNRHVATFSIPPNTSFETFKPENHVGWDNRYYPTVARDYGSSWYQENRSAVLLVPSVIAPCDKNLVINPNYPGALQFVRSPSSILPFRWDERLRSLLDMFSLVPAGQRAIDAQLSEYKLPPIGSRVVWSVYGAEEQGRVTGFIPAGGMGLDKVILTDLDGIELTIELPLAPGEWIALADANAGD